VPAKDRQERIELSRVGGYARRSDPASRQKEKAARARLAALQARRRLIEAAEAAAAAERELHELGLVVE
jgi:hypothetical protein